jgi:hypothetical protein
MRGAGLGSAIAAPLRLRLSYKGKQQVPTIAAPTLPTVSIGRSRLPVATCDFKQTL